jgi:hypothetical protein
MALPVVTVEDDFYRLPVRPNQKTLLYFAMRKPAPFFELLIACKSNG